MAIAADRTGNFPAAKERCPQGAIFKVPEHVRTTHSPDGGSVLDIRHGQIFRLNPAASRILELSKQGYSQAQIAEQLAQEFQIGCATAETDVRDFIQTLAEHQLLTAQDIDSLT